MSVVDTGKALFRSESSNLLWQLWLIDPSLEAWTDTVSYLNLHHRPSIHHWSLRERVNRYLAKAALTVFIHHYIQALTIFLLSCDPTPALYIYHRGKGSSQPFPPKARQMCVENLHNSSKFEAQTMLTFRELEATHGSKAMCGWDSSFLGIDISNSESAIQPKPPSQSAAKILSFAVKFPDQCGAGCKIVDQQHTSSGG